MFRLCIITLVLVVATDVSLSSPISSSKRNCNIPENLKKEIANYQPFVNKIINTVTNGALKGKVWKELAEFVDKFGNRISGSKNLENAIDYMLNKTSAKGLDNVHGEPVEVVRWVRGKEAAKLLQPRQTDLPILGLGGSVGTPPEGITAEVMVVKSFDELKQRPNEVNGKILVFNEKWISYGETVKYRDYAAEEGAKLGAVATLVRSVTPFSISTLHTGWQDYADNVTKIPTASITIEDAEMLHRMYKRGEKIVINMKMEAKMLDPVISRNTIAEVQGRSKPEKVVIVSGHLDSWDVGTGAMDDGAGAFISYYSLVVMKKLQLIPKRTVRAILWTGEEEGLIGAFAYAKAHKNEQNNFNLIMESDEGTFTPQGLSFFGNEEATCIMGEIMKLLGPINATDVESSNDVGSDIMVWANAGIPMAALKNANQNYFWFHHSVGDRMVVEDSDTLDKCLALWTAAAYVVADLSLDLPR